MISNKILTLQQFQYLRYRTKFFKCAFYNREPSISVYALQNQNLFLLINGTSVNGLKSSVAEPGAGAAGAATLRAAPEPEPIFLLVGARSRSRIF